MVLGAFGAGEFSLTLAYDAAPILRRPEWVVARQFTPVDMRLETWNRCDSIEVDSLPQGLTLDPVTGRITGTPAGPGYLTSLLTLSNPAGSSLQPLTFEIRPASAPVIVSPLRATARQGTPFTYALQVEQAAPETLWAGPLPPGLEFAGAAITGTPQLPGSFVVYLNAGSPAGDFVSERLELLVRPTYEDWIAAQGFSAAELANPLIAGPHADPDGDGARNQAEYLAGTNPRDPADVLQLSVRGEEHGYLVGWPRKPGQLYQVFHSDALEGPFRLLSSAGTPPLRYEPDRAGSGVGFLRVSVPE